MLVLDSGYGEQEEQHLFEVIPGRMQHHVLEQIHLHSHTHLPRLNILQGEMVNLFSKFKVYREA